MTAQIDLHTHSNHSDGELSPKRLIELASRSGVGVLALTDHDSVAGIEEALSVAQANNITLIPGIEISTSWLGKEIHIVGLNIDYKAEHLTRKLQKQNEKRQQRAVEIASKLEKLGMDQVYQSVRDLAENAFIGRLHFAKYLTKQGHSKDFHAAFRHYLAAGRPAYVPAGWLEMEEAIELIKSVGGRAVIAHPLRYRLKNRELEQLVGQFKDMNGDGIEAITAYQLPQQLEQIIKYIKNYDLLASCGSDFHGPGTNRIQMGRLNALPDICRPIWYDWDLQKCL